MNINVLYFSRKDRKDFRQERKVFTIKPLLTLRFFLCDTLRETYFEIA
jgi:hypothetical protein